MTKTLRLLQALCLMVSLAWISSCSNSESDFYKYIGSDNVFTVSVDVKELLVNSGVEFTKDGAEFPSYYKNILGSEFDDLKGLVEADAFEAGRMMVSAIYDKSEDDVMPYVLVRISNEDNVTKWLRQNDYEKSGSKGDMTVYNKRRNTAFIDGNMLILAEGDVDDAYRTVKHAKAAAEDTPIKTWQEKVLSDGTVSGIVSFNQIDKADRSLREMLKTSLSMYDITESDLKEASFTFVAELEGLELEMDLRCVNANGDNMMNIKGENIDKALLKYLNKVDFVAMLASPDKDGKWKEIAQKMIRENGGQVPEGVNTLIKNCTGKMMISFGYKDVYAFSNGEGMHFVLALQVEDGKGAVVVDALRSICTESGMPIKDDGKGFEIPIPNVSVYCYTDGNNVVISNSKNTDSASDCEIKASDFEKGWGELIVKIPAEAKNITSISLPYGIDGKIVGDDKGAHIEVKLTDADGYFLENILRTVSKF